MSEARAGYASLVLLAAVLLAGCHRHAPAVTPPASAARTVSPLPLSQADLGVSLLAEVANARFALSLGDVVAAGNDISAARAFAAQLPNRPSKLILPDPRGEGRALFDPAAAAAKHEPLTDFQAVVTLDSARTQLPDHVAQADSFLRALQSRVPQGLIPPDLPLLRVAAALDQARAAATEGRSSNLKTQLLCASALLKGYPGNAHRAGITALAADIDQTLANPRTLQTMSGYRVDSWAGQVAGWLGSDRWNAPRG